MTGMGGKRHRFGIDFRRPEPSDRSMDTAFRIKLCDQFDATPANVADFRKIVRALVANLPCLDPLEAEIMAWDVNGRAPSQYEQLRERAWDFREVGETALRRRLFAGFVTTGDMTDGHGADFLIDCALAAGIAADNIYEAMTS